VEAAELTAITSKSKPAVRFASTSEDVCTDKVLDGPECILRPVLQNEGPQVSLSLNLGRSSHQNQNGPNSTASGRSGSDFQNRHFSPLEATMSLMLLIAERQDFLPTKWSQPKWKLELSQLRLQ